MNQQKVNSHSQHFDFIVNALYKKKRYSIKEQVQAHPAQSLKRLYETMSGVVMSLDQKISQCKKYNESKIHRKYQIIIIDLQKRIQFLQTKLQQQNRARSPSKKYIQNLVDKLVSNRFQIQNLTRLTAELTRENNQLKKKIKIYQEGQCMNDKQEQGRIQNSLEKQDYFKTQAPNQSLNSQFLKNEVANFLGFKNQIRKRQNLDKSKFEKFLIRNKQKIIFWTMRQFLHSTDKFVQLNLSSNDDKAIINNIKNQQLKSRAASHSMQERSITSKTQQRNRRNIYCKYSVSTKNQPSFILK